MVYLILTSAYGPSTELGRPAPATKCK